MWNPSRSVLSPPTSRFGRRRMGESSHRLTVWYSRSRSHEWRTSRAVSRRPSWKRTPGRSRNRYRRPSFSVWTSEASQGTIRVPSTARRSVSKTLGATSLCSSVSQEGGSRLRTTPAIGTWSVPPPIWRSGSVRAAGASAFPSSRVVDVGSVAAKLQAPHPRARDAVVHVVEERYEDRGIDQRVLELPIEALPGGRTGPRCGPPRGSGRSRARRSTLAPRRCRSERV